MYDRFTVEKGEQFSIVKCESCDFQFLNPRPDKEEMASYYAETEYQPFISAQDKLKIWDRLYRFVRTFALRNKRNKIETLLPTGRLLDFGCGTGEFLLEMKKHGWQVEGLEPGSDAVRFAVEQYRLNVNKGGETEFQLLGENYDIITLWHVLEHVYHPGEVVEKCGKLLTDKGWLLIAVPNIRSYDAGFYGPHWVPLDSPRHLSHFTPESMQRLFSGTNLEIVQWTAMPLDAFYNCLMSEFLHIKIKNVYIVLKPFYLLRAMVVALRSVFGSANVENQEGQNGSSILYFVQKKRVENEN